jgi:hypothetical protein
MTFYYLYQKYKRMNITIWEELLTAPTKTPLLIFINTVLMCLMYIGAFLGKVVSSITAVDAYANSSHTVVPAAAIYPEIFFPFKPAYMSISSTCIC